MCPHRLTAILKPASYPPRKETLPISEDGAAQWEALRSLFCSKTSGLEGIPDSDNSYGKIVRLTRNTTHFPSSPVKEGSAPRQNCAICHVGDHSPRRI
ncbi:uncharacterized protein ACLA_015230 [Aspergillus clavatus NRRL 1]|uniref:Uncharacterized protein n=1 Tax=Aspergillus clavatus (strain ATCC 1007 / CBS 513.65 / DSM 816 / NCTC 3887 / NRRL 1 / QM 1276 / 107) TaxID=344612 RepID=A1CBG7_ASPCL|nr:uncharacterized protein ACLA_015230 [Aspergillus clavatus NRRL 1]EAW13085.1 hypothetical protein ACLA_015230 [Aspergillus clavatus NRRL 1]